MSFELRSTDRKSDCNVSERRTNTIRNGLLLVGCPAAALTKCILLHAVCMQYYFVMRECLKLHLWSSIHRSLSVKFWSRSWARMLSEPCQGKICSNIKSTFIAVIAGEEEVFIVTRALTHSEIRPLRWIHPDSTNSGQPAYGPWDQPQQQDSAAVKSIDRRIIPAQTCSWCWGKQEHSEKTCTSMGRTCKLHTERPCYSRESNSG